MEKFFNFEKLNSFSAAKFTVGDYAVKLGELFKKIAPMGKITFISFSDTHKRRAKSLFPALNLAGAKMVSLIMPEPVRYTVEYFSALFNLPEEIRAAITFDRELYKAASYYAAVKGIPLIYIPESACAADTLEKKFYIKNGDGYDKVSGATDVFVIVDGKIVKNDVAAGYAFNMARLATLIDYRITAAGEKTDAAAYLTVREGVMSTYGILSEQAEERPLCALYNGFKIAVSDGAENFSFIGRSSERISAILFSGGLAVKPETEFYYAIKILELYSVAFKITREAETFPNYVGRAKTVADTLKISEFSAVSALLGQIKMLRDKLGAVFKKINGMQKETEELFLHKSGLLGAFYALGGAEVKVKESLIKYAGDTPFGFNALSFLREAGITDYVKNL